MDITIRNSERNKTTHQSKKMSNTDLTEKNRGWTQVLAKG